MAVTVIVLLCLTIGSQVGAAPSAGVEYLSQGTALLRGTASRHLPQRKLLGGCYDSNCLVASTPAAEEASRAVDNADAAVAETTDEPGRKLLGGCFDSNCRVRATPTPTPAPGRKLLGGCYDSNCLVAQTPAPTPTPVKGKDKDKDNEDQDQDGDAP